MRTKPALLLLLAIFLISSCSKPVSSLTPVPRKTYPSTPTPVSARPPTKTVIPTINLDHTALTATIEAQTHDCEVLGKELSPDQQWLAIMCSAAIVNSSDPPSTFLKIVNLQTFHEWLLSYYQIYGKHEIEALGWMSDGTISPADWSLDGFHLYVKIMPQVYSEYLYNRTAALFSLNLRTGELNEILDALPVQETFYDFSFSKDERRIAYIRLLDHPLKLDAKDLATRETQSIGLEPRFDSAGSMIWSQDGSSLIFLAVDFPEGSSGALNTIYKWDTQSGELENLFDIPDTRGRLFVITKWDEENGIIMLRDYFEDQFLFKVDLSTGQMQPESR